MFRLPFPPFFWLENFPFLKEKRERAREERGKNCINQELEKNNGYYLTYYTDTPDWKLILYVSYIYIHAKKNI